MWKYFMMAVPMALMGCKSSAAQKAMSQGTEEPKQEPKQEKAADVKNVARVSGTKDEKSMSTEKVGLDDQQEPKGVLKTDAEWKKELTPEQYRVLRQAGTDRPFSKEYEKFQSEGKGSYVCAACGQELFRSAEKFDSHCGWPSFFDPAKAKSVIIRADLSGGMVREEVICAGCEGHLGHIFRGENFKTPTNHRYCINATSLKFVADQPAAGDHAAGEKK